MLGEDFEVVERLTEAPGDAEHIAYEVWCLYDVPHKLHRAP